LHRLTQNKERKGKLSCFFIISTRRHFLYFYVFVAAIADAQKEDERAKRARAEGADPADSATKTGSSAQKPTFVEVARSPEARDKAADKEETPSSTQARPPAAVEKKKFVPAAKVALAAPAVGDEVVGERRAAKTARASSEEATAPVEDAQETDTATPAVESAKENESIAQRNARRKAARQDQGNLVPPASSQ